MFDSSSTSYTIQAGEMFLVQDERDFLVCGRIKEIKDDTRGDANDEVNISYTIYGPGIFFLPVV
jgi:hypothetical protein